MQCCCAQDKVDDGAYMVSCVGNIYVYYVPISVYLLSKYTYLIEDLYITDCFIFDSSFYLRTIYFEDFLRLL